MIISVFFSKYDDVEGHCLLSRLIRSSINFVLRLFLSGSLPYEWCCLAQKLDP